MSDPWKIIETTEYKEWKEGLTDEQLDAIRRRLHQLEERGPSLGRPLVDQVKGSQLKNLKEFRVSSTGALRILFIFGKSRNAIFLLGGNKSKNNEWNEWYRKAIPRAELIYKRYLDGHGRDQ